MHDHLMRKAWLAGWIVIVTLAAAGCFQPAGGGLEATNVAQSLPTFTPLPTDTPNPSPVPTEMPTEEVVILPSDTPIPIATFPVVGTAISDASNQGQIDPLLQTSTAMFLQQSGGFQTFDQPTETLDPLYQQATAMVLQATQTAGAPMTMTAQIFFIPTATDQFFQPTWTPIPSGPIVQGNDCIYEVQPGDRNLYRISLLFGIPYMSIASASNMVNPNLIHVGDRLTIPGCGVTGYQPPSTSTPSATYSYPGATPVSGGGGSGQTYVVQQGDTLFALSLRWNTTVYTIAQLNNIPNINLIYIDQVINIP